MRVNISIGHRNLRAHNWLAYASGDRLLAHYSEQHMRGRCIDLGCGERPFEEYVLRFADSYVGLDWTSTQHKLKADVVADLNKSLPVRSGVADTILSVSVLEHLCEPQMMLDEAHRVLRRGGTLIVACPFQWQVHEAPHDFFRYTPHGLEYMLRKAGFAEVSISAQGGFFTMLVLKTNYFSMRFVRGPRLLQYVIRMVLLPFWFFGQALAPTLDRLDRDWCAESSGLWAAAKKP